LCCQYDNVIELEFGCKLYGEWGFLSIMLNNINKRTQAELSMLVVAFVWGTTFVMTKNALDDIGPFLFLGIRFIILMNYAFFLIYPG
jgi:hypothetical protein